MGPKFNIDRPKISDEEIKKHQDFDSLVRQFKEQSIKQAKGDESWWKNKKIRYSTIIAGVTVICTITYLSLFKTEKKSNTTHETLITQKKQSSYSPVQAAFIHEPSSKLKIRYTAYIVNNASGGTLTHSTASKIKIPKNSFADKNGKDIVGDVTIEYKEFHDHGDVILSGIPMGYDSAGTRYNLETAGMFDIRGSQNGEPVFIKPGKELQIELASRSNENRFNQYYLDTIAKNWHYLKKDFASPLAKTTKPVPQQQPVSAEEALIAGNPKAIALKQQIDVIIPKKIDSVKVAYTKKAALLPSPKQPAQPAKATGRPSFKLDANPAEFPELQAFKNAVFEVGSENKGYSKDLTEVTWSSIQIKQGPVKGKNYLLQLRYRNRAEELVVYPVLNEADYAKAKAIYDQRLEDYNTLVEKKQADEKRLIQEMEAKQAAYVADLKKKQDDYKAACARIRSQAEREEQNELTSNFNTLSNQARATRLFSVSKFGVYNSDCPHSPPQGTSVNAIFIVAGKNEKAISPETIYLVDHVSKTVYSMSQQNGFLLKYNPGNEYSICVFAAGKLFLCNKSSFKEAVDNEGNHFVLSPLPDGADNVIDFKKALEI